MSELIRKIHPLLTPEDVALLDKLAGSDDPELAKLRDLVWRFSKLKVSEGYFPKYAALIDESIGSAFAVRLVEKLPVGGGKLVWKGSPSPLEQCLLLTTTLECSPKDVMLLARPCLRIARNVSPETRDRLAELGRLCVTVGQLPLQSPDSSQLYMKPAERVEGVHHLWQGPALDFLADEEGYGRQRQLTVLRQLSKPVMGIFGSGALDTDQNAYPADLGVFLTGGTVVSVDLQYPILENEELEIHTGLVMARYTAEKLHL